MEKPNPIKADNHLKGENLLKKNDLNSSKIRNLVSGKIQETPFVVSGHSMPPPFDLRKLKKKKSSFLKEEKRKNKLPIGILNEESFWICAFLQFIAAWTRVFYF